MDSHTFELLEFDQIRTLLAGYAVTGMGKQLSFEIEPSKDLNWIRQELKLVSQCTEAIGMGQSPPLGGIYDVRLEIKRAAIGTMLSAEQLLRIADTLMATGAIYRYRMRLDGRLDQLIAMLAGIEDLGGMAKTITNCIDGRGHILDSASVALGEIRQKLNDLDERVKNQIKHLLRDPEIRKVLRQPSATIHGDHYVLPVSANYRQKIPGIVHRTSATGETLYIEPIAVSHLGAERTILKGEEDREEKKILRKLSADVGKIAKPLAYSLDVLAKFDLITAKARYALEYQMYPPDMNTEGKLYLRAARHPLLEALFRPKSSIALPSPKPIEATPSTSEKNFSTESKTQLDSPVPKELDRESNPKKVVPIDIHLGVAFNLLILSGPNTGGKTVTLKTTGLLVLMAQCGMHIPASEGSIVPVFDHIYADIGDEQSLTQSLSTFSSHITRIAKIFKLANQNSLILLDELGAGTDPTEGAALGRAILDHLDEMRCRALVTTHLGDLKTYAFKNERAENGAVEFDPETLRPSYHLHIGQFGLSVALKIARRLQLPPSLLRNAHRYLRKRRGKGTDLTRLQELKQETEKARNEALAAKVAADRQREEYELKKVQFEKEVAEANKLREWRNQLQPNMKVHVQKFDKTGKIVRIDPRKLTVSVSVGIGQWEVPFDEIFPEKPIVV